MSHVTYIVTVMVLVGTGDSRRTACRDSDFVLVLSADGHARTQTTVSHQTSRSTMADMKDELTNHEVGQQSYGRLDAAVQGRHPLFARPKLPI